jgi:hypothetical protein
MQDVGTYKLEGIDEPISCIQIMPEALKDRPATSFSGCTMTMRPYAMAPGVGDEEGGTVTLIFSTLTGKSAKTRRPSQVDLDPDDEEGEGDSAADAALCLNLMTTTALAHEGYVTKTSNGVSLLAFATPLQGFSFVQQIARELQSGEMERFKFCCGLHTGVPTSVAPNKASGRADYLGPPVNASARLLSLGAEEDKFHVGNVAVAVSESTWMGLDDKAGLELVGSFQLKGIGNEVECYKYTPQ